ncbi:uncharacterized protein LOC126380604 [Pectinophora gossypiella]|uniref:uncharacterized protein LOC126380604 n=1 Tax=Pectinophora gossypiella TaxID=13191 RepID=UPI00214E5210|nr:uncharacterized protein LOC126380604 [Pectinophora gossypiella]
MVYLKSIPLRSVCNSLLLKDTWSVTPGHCAAMRTDPDMSHSLLLWRVKYSAGDKFLVPSGLELSDDTLQAHANRMIMVGWISHLQMQGGESPHLSTFDMKPVMSEKCMQFMSPIIDMRSYEFCILLQQRTNDPPGSY